MTDSGKPRGPATPVVTYGLDAIRQLPSIVADRDPPRVLLVCGRRSFEASGAAGMLPAIEREAQVRLWRDFSPNPDAAELVEGLALIDEFAPDVIVGVGGGSTMDLAKLLCAFDGIRDLEALHDAIRAGARIDDRRPELCLVPTTSGSGSEATHFAVVYVGEDKHSVGGPALRPDSTILDPRLTLSGSPAQRATSGIDAICQAIESLWATGATATSRRFARRGLDLLLASIERFVAADDEEAAQGMSIGSHLAGCAIDVSKTTAAHALSYAITKRHGVAHGHAVALTLGAFIESHADPDPGRLQDGVEPREHAAAVREVLHALDARDGDEGRAAFHGLMERIGLTSDPSRVGVDTPEERAAIAAAVNTERLGNNPVALTPEELEGALERA